MRPALELLNDIAVQLGYRPLETIEGDLDGFDATLRRVFTLVIREIAAMDDWPLLRAEGEIITVAPYEVGKVDLTNGSTTVTGVDDPDIAGTLAPTWTTAMEGRVIRFGNEALLYRIETVTSATSLTINRAYQGDTTTDPIAYEILQDRYDLPTNFDRPISKDWDNFFDTTNATLVAIAPNEFRRQRKMRGVRQGEPEVFTIWGLDDAQEHLQVLFDPFPDEVRVLQFPYQKLHPEVEQDSDRVLFTPNKDNLLIDGTIYVMQRGPEDDIKAGAMVGDWLRVVNQKLSAQADIAQQLPRITVSNARKFREQARWKYGTARVNWGSLGDTYRRFKLGG
jgi:hypothetical protein